MLKASKLLMLRPQNSILQHLLPEAGPEGDITKSFINNRIAAKALALGAFKAGSKGWGRYLRVI